MTCVIPHCPPPNKPLPRIPISEEIRNIRYNLIGRCDELIGKNLPHEVITKIFFKHKGLRHPLCKCMDEFHKIVGKKSISQDLVFVVEKPYLTTNPETIRLQSSFLYEIEDGSRYNYNKIYGIIDIPDFLKHLDWNVWGQMKCKITIKDNKELWDKCQKLIKPFSSRFYLKKIHPSLKNYRFPNIRNKNIRINKYMSQIYFLSNVYTCSRERKQITRDVFKDDDLKKYLKKNGFKRLSNKNKEELIKMCLSF